MSVMAGHSIDLDNPDWIERYKLLPEFRRAYDVVKSGVAAGYCALDDLVALAVRASEEVRREYPRTTPDS